MTKAQKLLLARSLTRAFTMLRARLLTQTATVSYDGRQYRVDVDTSDNSRDVFRDGLWLGWVNGAGEPASMAGIDPALPTLVAAVAAQI
jgi:hypothetical protein